MMYRAVGKTDTGRIRDHNEDNLAIELPGEGEVGLFVVADGVGGNLHGEVASDLAVTTLRELFRENQASFAEYTPERDRELRGSLTGLVNEMIVAASAKIYERGQKNSEWRGMSTTTVTLVATGHGVFIGHVGDSRAYLLRAGKIFRLTEDHTFANYMIETGTLSEDQLREHPFANVLTRSVGSGPHVIVDTTFVEVEPDDRFVLCSDGLHTYLSAPEILEHSASSASAEALVDSLIADANARGGEDNITTLVVDVKGGVETLRTLALQEEIKLLQNMFLFEQLTDQEVMRLMKIMYSEHKHAGDVIIHEGTEGHELYFVSKGAVDVTLRNQHLTTIKAGGHFGELALLDDEVRAATVTAKTDVRLLTMKQGDFADILRTDHQLATKLLWSFLKAVAGNMRSLSKTVVKSSRLVDADEDATLIDFDAERFAREDAKK